MYILYTDKQEIFECTISLEGASLKNSQARLIVESDNLNLLFKGTIDASGKCTVPVKRLKNLIDESSKGQIRLEVIADDTYFTPWESSFQVKTSKKAVVEVTSQSNKPSLKELKPTVSINHVHKHTQTLNKPNAQSHASSLCRVLVHENINLSNISVNKAKLNKIIESYMRIRNIANGQKSKIIEEILYNLAKT